MLFYSVTMKIKDDFLIDIIENKKVSVYEAIVGELVESLSINKVTAVMMIGGSQLQVGPEFLKKIERFNVAGIGRFELLVGEPFTL